jgi:hypothetical protein
MCPTSRRPEHSTLSANLQGVLRGLLLIRRGEGL